MKNESVTFIVGPVRYKELDFTVPEFSGYIQRLDEYKQWCVDKKNMISSR